MVRLVPAAAPMTAQLRVRRWLDDVLISERFIDCGGDEGAADAEWAVMAQQAGCRWRVQMDDPEGDLPYPVVLEGGP